MPETLISIHHDGSARYVRPLDGAIHIGGRVQIRLRAGTNVPVDRVFLYTRPDGEGQYEEMQVEAANEPCCWWSIHLSIQMPLTGYRFLILMDGSPYWYNAAGLHASMVTDQDDFRLLADFQSADWVQRSVFYQIFPDRFADGDPANNVRDGEFIYREESARARRWGEPPSPSGRVRMVEFFGGDLQGIIDHLDYLENLGINALYLTPIFTSYSNHRYDVVDYFNVDPHLGGNPALATLRQATAKRNIRLMLDIVPNHCGVAHPWFQQALVDITAPSAEYFTFTKHPDEYACWLGVRSLPKLNYNSLALRRVMYKSRDSVFRYWMKPPYAIDGWRIDVANMLARQGIDQLGMEVGRGIRAAVKQENPQAYLLGENFFDPSNQLQGDFLDAAMNYAGFSMPLWHWLSGFQVSLGHARDSVHAPGGFDTPALVASWQAYRASVPWQIVQQQFNALGTHDTQRIRALLRNDMGKLRLAVTLLMTVPGVPCIFYGDEIGLGGDGNDNRLCMNWDESGWDGALLEFHRRLIHLRRQSPALIKGGFQVLAVDKDEFIFLRDAEEQQIVVAANRGPLSNPATRLDLAAAGIEDGAIFEEFFSGQQARVENGCLSLPGQPQGASIWIHEV